MVLPLPASPEQARPYCSLPTAPSEGRQSGSHPQPHHTPAVRPGGRGLTSLSLHASICERGVIMKVTVEVIQTETLQWGSRHNRGLSWQTRKCRHSVVRGVLIPCKDEMTDAQSGQPGAESPSSQHETALLFLLRILSTAGPSVTVCLDEGE